ncbi:cell wall glucanase (Scw4), putative [Trichophyton verrucosum HKI 0517]|uniref:Cell wall glucanase (Scw4), putative n=1 Tax=Trichophyton verrucosum (strain HKI 0517) TaxID=663202 RepID=D4D983_TRIVH|nr:cell wall glucanase (Scw4), putative [Trichophyton verrucosum HKI 0517]EFE41575.1 cell wall glucanase (Scw4), putative [Trichophyton verrucosum HKI 0517]
MLDICYKSKRKEKAGSLWLGITLFTLFSLTSLVVVFLHLRVSPTPLFISPETFPSLLLPLPLLSSTSHHNLISQKYPLTITDFACTQLASTLLTPFSVPAAFSCVLSRSASSGDASIKLLIIILTPLDTLFLSLSVYLLGTVRSKMKTNLFIFAALFLPGSVVARPHNHNHAYGLEKRAYVTDTIVVKVPEVINWVDNAGNTVTIETKGMKSFKTIHPTSDNGDVGTTIAPNTATMATTTVTNIPTSVSTVVPKPEPTTEMKIPDLKPEPTEIKQTTKDITTTKVKPSEPVITEPKSTDKQTGVPPVQPTITEPKKTETTAIEPIITGPGTTAKPTEPLTTSTQSLAPSKPSTVPAPTSSPPKDPTEKWTPANGFGICYAPYAADGKCKNQDQVNADFAKLNDYSIVRSYGVDCNQIAMMLNAAKTYNKKVMLGLFTIQNVDSDLNIFLAAAKNNWAYIYAIAIGNEVVNTGKASANALVNAVNHSRAILRANGYNGPVVAVDTVNAMTAHPEICYASDFCAVNIHPFFDPHTSASEAGQFVREQSKAVSNAVHGAKRVIVTETGWPHGGYQNGEAFPSRENQRVAIENIKQAYKDTNGELLLFSAFDDPWKVDGSNTFGAEKYWGIY